MNDIIDCIIILFGTFIATILYNYLDKYNLSIVFLFCLLIFVIILSIIDLILHDELF